MAEVLQRIFNWFALALMLLGAGVLVLSETRIVPPSFMLSATIPVLVQLLAGARRAPSGLRLLAMAVNWTAAVLAASLAATALTGIGGTSPLCSFLGSAAVLYGWNAGSVVMARL